MGPIIPMGVNYGYYWLNIASGLIKCISFITEEFILKCLFWFASAAFAIAEIIIIVIVIEYASFIIFLRVYLG